MYIHIPFCKSKCDYCDFYSEEEESFKRKGRKGTQSFFRDYLDTIVKDIYEQVESFKIDRIPTAYIGGGTPSVLGADIKILFDALKELPVFKPEEFTIEANPESLTEEFLAICKEGGVTRLSLGVQTFFEASRRAVSRAGDIAAVEKALSLATQYYPNDLSVDLITGFPFHTKEIVLNDIKRVLDYDPAHISVYSLTLEKNTKLYEKIKRGELHLPEQDIADELWLTAREELLKVGFKHYEVSNFAREEKECKHNIRYWRMEGWLGAGPSASGTIIDEKAKTALRYTYKETVNELRKLTRININNDELLREIIMMGYRYCEGPDPKWGVEKLIPNTLAKWKDKNKMLFLNSFLVDAFNELDNSR